MGTGLSPGSIGQIKEREIRRMVWWARAGFGLALGMLPLAGLIVGGALGSPFVGALLGGAVAVVSLLVSLGGQENPMAALGMRQPTAREARRLRPMLADLAGRAAVAAPDLRIVESSAINAFAVELGSSPAVGVTSGALAALERRELRAVLAHEVAHLKHRDTFLLGWHVSAVGVLTSVVAAAALIGFGVIAAAGRVRRKGAGGIFVLLLLLLLVGGVTYGVGIFLSRVFGMASNRELELAADARGAILSADGFALASALAKMAGQPQSVTERNAPLTSLFVVDLAMRSSAAEDVFSTHPDVSLRIERLKAFASALGHPQFHPRAARPADQVLLAPLAYPRPAGPRIGAAPSHPRALQPTPSPRASPPWPRSISSCRSPTATSPRTSSSVVCGSSAPSGAMSRRRAGGSI